jgi:uncharacterized repeat protein (TIGR04138 family)
MSAAGIIDMNDTSFQQGVEAICAKDPRYHSDAYYFLREALDFTVKSLKKTGEGANRHVTGRELLDGWRQCALQEFGPLALTVMQSWGLRCTEDVGELVFNLVESGRLGKTEQDSRADFAGGYDFREAFSKPYEVAEPQPARGNRSRRRRG